MKGPKFVVGPPERVSRTRALMYCYRDGKKVGFIQVDTMTGRPKYDLYDWFDRPFGEFNTYWVCAAPAGLREARRMARGRWSAVRTAQVSAENAVSVRDEAQRLYEECAGIKVMLYAADGHATPMSWLSAAMRNLDQIVHACNETLIRETGGLKL